VGTSDPGTATATGDLFADTGTTDAGLTDTADTPVSAVTDTADAAAAADLTGYPDNGGITCNTQMCAKLAATPYCHLQSGACVQCLVDFHCAKLPGHECKNGSCTPISCKPGHKECHGPFLATCKADGKGFDEAACPESKPHCLQKVDGASCALCAPGETFCAPPAKPGGDSKVLMQCHASGKDADVVTICKGAAKCLDGKCQACIPGLKSCQGSKAIACKLDGSGQEVVKDCAAADQACLAGTCVDPCSGDLKSNTHAGCRYWAVDLDNAVHKNGNQTFDAQNMQFAVIVSNTVGLVSGVTAKIKVRSGKHVTEHVVQPGYLAALQLPDPNWGLPPQNLDGTTIADRAFEISSNVPIVAYQFNPLENYGVFSNDASLLLPEHVLGQHYIVMSRRQNFPAHPSYVTVVGAGTQGKKVLVKLKVTAKTLAGPGIPALSPGSSYTAQLKPGQVLNLETGAIGADLTGTRVDADGPIAVFAGSEAANVPDTNDCIKTAGAKTGVCKSGGWACTSIADCPVTCCADHIEQQLFPIDAWGQTYVASKLKKRGLEPDLWRILAAKDTTVVTTDPPQTVAKITLNAGEWIEFASTTDFRIHATGPIQVGQFMASANAPDANNDLCTGNQLGQSVCATYLAKTGKSLPCSKHAECPNIPQPGDAKTGDPAFILAVAEKRWLSEYVFLTPDKYGFSYVNVVREKGTQVAVDAKMLPDAVFTGVGTTKYEAARLQVQAGGHAVVATQPVGVTVYGWDQHVSYGYPAGAGF